MTIKALKKQLIAAVAMVIVAAIAVSSSTFAWFASNTRVTASQMSVTATTADPYLQIKLRSAADTAYASTATFTAENNLTDLRLVSPKAYAYAMTWYEAKSDDPNQAITAATEASKTDVTTNFTSYFVKQELTIKNAANIKAENLEVQAKFTGADAAKLDHAVRVLVITSTGSYALFDSTGAIITTGGDPVPTASDKVLAAEMAANSTLDVDVYMYFDGTDTLAKNVTEINAAAVVANLAFSIKGDPASDGWAANSATT